MAENSKSLDEIQRKLRDLHPQTDSHSLAYLLSPNNVNEYDYGDADPDWGCYGLEISDGLFSRSQTFVIFSFFGKVKAVQCYGTTRVFFKQYAHAASAYSSLKEVIPDLELTPVMRRLASKGESVDGNNNNVLDVENASSGSVRSNRKAIGRDNLSYAEKISMQEMSLSTMSKPKILAVPNELSAGRVVAVASAAAASAAAAAACISAKQDSRNEAKVAQPKRNAEVARRMVLNSLGRGTDASEKKKTADVNSGVALAVGESLSGSNSSATPLVAPPKSVNVRSSDASPFGDPSVALSSLNSSSSPLVSPILSVNVQSSAAHLLRCNAAVRLISAPVGDSSVPSSASRIESCTPSPPVIKSTAETLGQSTSPASSLSSASVIHTSSPSVSPLIKCSAKSSSSVAPSRSVQQPVSAPVSTPAPVSVSTSSSSPFFIAGASPQLAGFLPSSSKAVCPSPSSSTNCFLTKDPKCGQAPETKTPVKTPTPVPKSVAPPVTDVVTSTNGASSADQSATKDLRQKIEARRARAGENGFLSQPSLDQPSWDQPEPYGNGSHLYKRATQESLSLSSRFHSYKTENPFHDAIKENGDAVLCANESEEEPVHREGITVVESWPRSQQKPSRAFPSGSPSSRALTPQSPRSPSSQRPRLNVSNRLVSSAIGDIKKQLGKQNQNEQFLEKLAIRDMEKVARDLEKLAIGEIRH